MGSIGRLWRKEYEKKRMIMQISWGGVYWEIPIGAFAFLGEEVVIIRKMKCPERWCRKRVCDIWENRFGVIVIELKCPHCGEVVRVCCGPDGIEAGIYERKNGGNDQAILKRMRYSCNYILYL